MSCIPAFTKRVLFFHVALIFAIKATSLQAGDVVNPLDWEQRNSPNSECIAMVRGWEIVENSDGTKDLVLNEGMSPNSHVVIFKLSEEDRTRSFRLTFTIEVTAQFGWFKCEIVDKEGPSNSQTVSIGGNAVGNSGMRNSDGENVKFDLNLGSEPVTVTMEVDQEKKTCVASTNLGSSAEINFPQNFPQEMTQTRWFSFHFVYSDDRGELDGKVIIRNLRIEFTDRAK